MKWFRRLWRNFMRRPQDEGLPLWYDSRLRPGPVPGEAPVFLYMPWIPEHGDALIAKIERGSAGKVRFHPLDIVRDSDDVNSRLDVLVYAQENPDRWRRLLMRKLAPLARQVAGFVVSFDWHPVMREVVFACRSLGIPTILVPHESVFIDEDRYYVARNGAGVPATDYAFVWGEMQRRIFSDRGYPKERILLTGSPKFDIFHDYKPQLDREGFASIFGLDPARPIVLFAGQPLDSQVDSQRFAIGRQAQAIADLLDVAEDLGVQVVIRQPPARKVIVFKAERDRIDQSLGFAIDGPVKFAIAPEEAIHHAAAVLSINSTMLFEAVLMGRPSISMPYFEFEQIWQKLDIARAPDKDELRRLLVKALEHGRPMVSEDGMVWARRELSAGSFDGLAAARVAEALREVASAPRTETMRPHRAAEVAAGIGGRGSLACISVAAALPDFGKTLKKLLGAKSAVAATNAQDTAGADYFVHFDSRYRDPDPLWHRLRRNLGRSELFVERGILPALKGSTAAFGGSIVIDDVAAHFRGDHDTRMNRRLNGAWTLGAAETERVRGLVAALRAAHTPASGSGRRVLILDQLAEDRSLPPTDAGEGVLAGILRACVKSYPDAEVVIGRERLPVGPDSAWILSGELVARVCGTRKIPVVEADDQGLLPLAGFDEIHVATAEAGFMGLVMGIPVHCHWAAWYSGWGLTRDHVPIRNRTCARTLEELFHVACIELSRYFDAASGGRVEIETVLPPAPVEPAPIPAAAEVPASS